jgi:hypothetical protein
MNKGNDSWQACFTRFECKVFLTEALQYFGGAAAPQPTADP